VSVEAAGGRYLVRHGAHEQVVELADASRAGRDELHRKGGPEEVVSVMPERSSGSSWRRETPFPAGQGLVVVEAMKMENEIAAPRAGRVAELAVSPGQTVESGARLVVLE
jgi:biotin carboxyl carrier protein